MSAPTRTAQDRTITTSDDRERTAERLLKSSSKNSYDPDLEVSWDSQEVPGLAFMPLHRTTLYGTDLWRGMSEAQRIELSKQEIVSVARVGLWFELILMGMLSAHIFDLDPGTKHAQYALTEIGDEARHSVMFAKFASKFGGADYRPPAPVHFAAKLFRSVATSGPAMWAGTLLAEEFLDRLQRDMMHDESIQPIVRMINRIHVVEEARHVRFAREELMRSVDGVGKVKMAEHSTLAAAAGYVIAESLVNPAVYTAVGLDARQAVAAAKKNPNLHATRHWMGEKIMPVIEEAGMMTAPAKMIYRRAHLI